MQHATSYSQCFAPDPPSIEDIEALTPKLVDHMRDRIDGWLMALNTWADDDRDRLADIAAALKTGDDCEVGKLLRIALEPHMTVCAEGLAEIYLDRSLRADADARKLLKDFRP